MQRAGSGLICGWRSCPWWAKQGAVCWAGWSGACGRRSAPALWSSPLAFWTFWPSEWRGHPSGAAGPPSSATPRIWNTSRSHAASSGLPIVVCRRKQSGEKKGKEGVSSCQVIRPLCKCVLIEESLVYFEGKQRVIVEPIKWKSSVILIAVKVKTGSPRLRLALVLASLPERSCQQVASPAFFFYRLPESTRLAR